MRELRDVRCELGYRDTPPCIGYHPEQCNCPFLGSCSLRQAIGIFEDFRSYDIMEAFMKADTETPRGEVFYDPIYEEVWR